MAAWGGVEVSTAGAPAIVPAGWKWERVGPLTLIRKVFPSGLVATHSVETYTENDGPMERNGTWKRIVISRQGTDEYPAWDEMRDLIYSCGLFDSSRDVIMILPRKEEYVNLRSNAFHFWQEVSP